MSEQQVPVVKTTPTMAEYIRAVLRAWYVVGNGAPSEASIAILWAQYMIETGGTNCFGWNIGNVKHTAGDGYDYHCLRGVWEGVSQAEADRLIASGQAVLDLNESHRKAVGNRVSVIFQPPHPQTWFRTYPSLDAAMQGHLKLLANRFKAAWPSVLAGSVDGFAQALKSQGYFTADAGAYAAGMRGPFKALLATNTYEEMVGTMYQEPVTQPVETPEEEALVWDVSDFVTDMHTGARELIIEDLLDAWRKRPIDFGDV